MVPLAKVKRVPLTNWVHSLESGPVQTAHPEVQATQAPSEVKKPATQAVHAVAVQVRHTGALLQAAQLFDAVK